jgi:hypothetical protein
MPLDTLKDAKSPEFIQQQKCEFKNILLNIYQRCSPEKVAKIDSFMTIYFNGYEEKLFQQLKTKYSLSEQDLERFDNYMDTYQPIQKSVVTPRDALLLEQAQDEMSFRRTGSSLLRQTAPSRSSESLSLSSRGGMADIITPRMSESVSTSSKKKTEFVHMLVEALPNTSSRGRSYTTSAMYEGAGVEEFKKEKSGKAIKFTKGTFVDKKKCTIS